MGWLLKPKGGPRVKIKLIDVEQGRSFTDLACFLFGKMYSIHHLTQNEDGVTMSHTVRITGPLSFLWWKLVGQKVADGMEEQTKKILERARQLG